MKTIKLIPSLALLFVAALPWNATAINQQGLVKQLFGSPRSDNMIESMLVKTLREIKQGDTAKALDSVNQLIEFKPNFKLAHLIRGDLLAAKSGQLDAFGNANLHNKQDIDDFKAEAQVRVEHFLSDDRAQKIPNTVIRLDATQQHAIVVDTSKSRLYLYEKQQDGLQYVADYYVTIGKNGVDKKLEGDKRTPLGVYFTNKKLTGPLPDMYGDGAYPLSYPNEMDQHQSRSGSGIWLHGTPTDTYSRAPRASDGCVVLSNPDLKALEPVLKQGGVPVIIGNTFEWLTPAQTPALSQGKALEDAIESWRQDWVSQNSNQYLSHYSKQFFYSDGNYQKWADYKTQIQARKPKVEIRINDISMFNYPNSTQPMVVVNFEQDFRAPNLQNKMRKRQYWVLDNNQWKIMYEGAV